MGLGVRRRVQRRMVSRVSREVRDRGLTYLSLAKLRRLERCARAVEAGGIPGGFLEAGVALGGSAALLASLLPPSARFDGYDVFGLIPPTGDRDDAKSHERYAEIAAGGSRGIGGDEYYGYLDDLYERVCETLASFGTPVDGKRVALHRGLFEDTLHFAEGQRIALVHLDCDWYDSVRICLERTYPALSRGGFIVSDDYYTYGGCRDAVDEFLALHDDLQPVDIPATVGPQVNLVLRRS